MFEIKGEVLHDEHGDAEARGERARAEMSRLLHEEVDVYILLALMSGNQDIPGSAKGPLLILVSSSRYQYPLPHHLPSLSDTPRSWSGAMTAKILNSQRLYSPAIFSTKFLYQSGCSPQTDGIPARMPWLSSSSAVELRTPMLYTRGCRSWRWGRVYRNPWQHRHQPARAPIDTPKNPRRRKSTLCA